MSSAHRFPRRRTEYVPWLRTGSLRCIPAANVHTSTLHSNKAAGATIVASPYARSADGRRVEHFSRTQESSSRCLDKPTRRRIRAVEPTTVEDIFRRYLDPVYRFIYRHVGNQHDAEDLTSEVFLKAARGIDTVAHPRPLERGCSRFVGPSSPIMAKTIPGTTAGRYRRSRSTVGVAGRISASSVRSQG